jgi:cell division protein FtsB
MRVFTGLLALLAVLLQYHLWMSDRGNREVVRLQAALAAQSAANHEQRERNRQLAAEVTNLKVGFAAIEERARSELGMVGRSETFYQVVRSATVPAQPSLPNPSAGPVSRPLTARAQ